MIHPPTYNLANNPVLQPNLGMTCLITFHPKPSVRPIGQP